MSVGIEDAARCWAMPKAQMMQLEALKGGSTPWKWFSACAKPAPNSPGPWEGGGSSCHTLAKLCDHTVHLDLPAGASYPFLRGSPGGLATAQVVKCAFK